MKGMGYVIKQGLAIVLSVAMLAGGMELPALAAENGAEIVPEVVTEANEADVATKEITTAEISTEEVSVMEAAKASAAGEEMAVDTPDRLDDAEADTGTLGTNNGITWTYDKDTCTLTLSGEDELKGDYDNHVSPLHELYSEKDIKKIVFSDCTLTGRADSLFARLSDLEEIVFSGFDTSDVTSMDHMFYGCSGLTSLEVSKFDTSNVRLMNYMFLNCANLTSLDVSGWDTGRVGDMELIFGGCSSLTSLDVSNWNTGSAESMEYMFSGCSSLTSLDVSNWNTGSAEFMDGMFFGCSGLTSLDVSSWNTEKVSDMGGMFSGCSGLTSLDVSEWNTGAVENMASMFRGCSGLTSLDVSSWNTEKVSDMSGMFSGCSGLTSLDVSDWNTGSAEFMDGMFLGCSGLTSLNLGNWDTGRVANMSEMFSGCSGLTSLEVSNWNTGSAESMEYMFSGCSGLTSLDVSSWNTEKVSDMRGMFSGCSGLTSLDLGSWNTKNAPDMSDLIYDCIHLNRWISPELYCEIEYSSATFYDKDGNPYTRWIPENTPSLLLTTIPLANAYTVCFDNNLEGKDHATATQLVKYGTEGQKLYPNLFHEPGCSFVKWTTEKDGKGTAYDDEAEVTEDLAAIGETITLYAQWEVSSYSIEFNGNGVDGSMEGMPDLVCGTRYTLPPNTFQKQYYTFRGWNTEADGTGTFCRDKAEVKNLTTENGKKVTLYAQWTPTRYSITYYLNGGTNSIYNHTTYHILSRDIKLEDPVKKGYTFGGWYSDEACTAKVTEIASGSTGDKVFYAKWIGDEPGGTPTPGSTPVPGGTPTPSSPEPGGSPAPGNSPEPGGSPVPSSTPEPSASPAPTATPAPSESPKPGDGSENGGSGVTGTHRIVYSLGGGTNAAANPSSYNGMTAVKLADPTKTGYTFGGWYSDSALKKGISEIAAGSAGNLTLYAKWTANKYTISFDSNGGSGSMKAMTNRAYGAAYELSANKFKKAGSVFIGWGSSAAGTEVTYRDCDRVKDLTAEQGGSVTLYARWLDLAANNAYSLTYRLNGGINDSGNPAYYTEGAAVTLKAPTKPGYSFDGWYAKSNLKGSRTESIDATSKGNKTLYAKWTPLTYTIKFNGNPTGITQGNSKATSGAGGKVENSMADVTNVKTGKKVTLKANKFKYNGYTFAGWNTKPDGSGTAVKNKAGVKDLCLGEDGAFRDTVTLYAQWTETKYSITYKLNKGKLPTADDTTAPGAPSCPKSYTIGSDTITLAAPTRSGYTFDGWYTTKKCKDGTKVDSIPSGSTGKLILYAKWKKSGS